MVVFRLRPTCSATAEENFFAAVRELGRIEEVQELDCLRQINSKCRFLFGISMKFADEVAYERYCAHPAHVRFVEERWKPEVEEFMEIDLVPR